MTKYLRHIAIPCRNIVFPSFLFILFGMALSSCSDDTLDISSSSKHISFDVKENKSGDNADLSTRTLPSAKASVTALGQNTGLFLVPIVSSTPVEDFYRSHITRGQSFNSETLQTFGVFAGYASESSSTSYIAKYMDNVEVTRDNGWTPKEEYLWPGDGGLHFNAYAPYVSSPHDEGVTEINNNGGPISLSYVSPKETADQSDLLFASPVEASSSPCSLTFNHALARIRFAAGAKLSPCTVKNISISGIYSNATLNLESGSWSDLTGAQQFSISPDKTMTADTNSEYVAPGTLISSDEESFMFIPQLLDENVVVSITLDFNGTDSTLTASLANQEWEAGNTYTYRISADPAADSLILEVTGNFLTDYTGSETSFNVRSSYNDGTSVSAVKWTAEFVDENGNVISQPNWISDITLSGEGDTKGNLATLMQDIEFIKMSNPTQILQNASDINISSGYNPYNLSSESGNSTVENTANTYIVNNPGSYSIPLVYGNAIKNGAAYKSAYTATTHHANTLKTFTNHLGNAITSPYIYDNSECSPQIAELIWEDELNLVRNVRLSSDSKSILFDVPANTIRQGNALIAVKDNNGQVMWSWQVWVTDFNPSEDVANIAVSGKSYNLWTANLGYIEGGDQTRFPECEVLVRFTQIDLPEGVQPLSKTIKVEQNGAEFSTPSSNTFYQWGRKDPMMSSVKQWFNAAHQEIKVLPTQDALSLSATDLLKRFILYPQTFFTGSHSSDNVAPTPYINLWNVNYSSANIKSIYDPSPAGYVVPYDQPLTFLQQSSANSNGQYENTNVTSIYRDGSDPSYQKGYYVTIDSTGQTLFFPPLGYRASSTGDLNESTAQYWYSHATSIRAAGELTIDYTNGYTLLHNLTNPPLHAFSIRPIKE